MLKTNAHPKKIKRSKKKIHWTKSTNYIKIQNKCKLNGKILIEIYPLDNSSLNVFEKLINFDDFLQLLKSGSERCASQNGRKFFVSLDDF